MKVTDYFTKKIVIGLSVITTLLAIIGGLWGFDSHYASAKDMNGLEIRVAEGFENTQNKLDVRFLQFMYDKLTQDMYDIKRQLSRYPNDKVLEEDYKEVLRKRSRIKEKLDEALKRIKVN